MNESQSKVESHIEPPQEDLVSLIPYPQEVNETFASQIKNSGRGVKGKSYFIIASKNLIGIILILYVKS